MLYIVLIYLCLANSLLLVIRIFFFFSFGLEVYIWMSPGPYSFRLCFVDFFISLFHFVFKWKWFKKIKRNEQISVKEHILKVLRSLEKRDKIMSIYYTFNILWILCRFEHTAQGWSLRFLHGWFLVESKKCIEKKHVFNTWSDITYFRNSLLYQPIAKSNLWRNFKWNRSVCCG